MFNHPSSWTSLTEKCVTWLEIKAVGNVWFFYWEVVSIILKMLVPMPVVALCMLLVVWRMVAAHRVRVALFHTSKNLKNTSNTAPGRGRHPIGRTGGVSTNTKALILLCVVYFIICLPNVFDNILISLAHISCTMTFVGLLAKDLFPSFVNFTLFTRIFDALIFFVIPEFRIAFFNILHGKFCTKVS